jgi:hypothetical protein
MSQLIINRRGEHARVTSTTDGGVTLQTSVRYDAITDTPAMASANLYMDRRQGIALALELCDALGLACEVSRGESAVNLNRKVSYLRPIGGANV